MNHKGSTLFTQEAFYYRILKDIECLIGSSNKTLFNGKSIDHVKPMVFLLFYLKIVSNIPRSITACTSVLPTI